jgi:hypothetical protein
MKQKVLTFCVVLSFLAAGILGVFITNTPPAAAGEPEWGRLTFESGYKAQGTSDVSVLAAPGSNYAWLVTSAWYHVTTAEANGNVQIEDAAATPTVVVSIPLDNKGSEGMIYFGDGVLCHQNSAVQLDFSGSTGEIACVINGYKVYSP